MGPRINTHSKHPTYRDSGNRNAQNRSRPTTPPPMASGTIVPDGDTVVQINVPNVTPLVPAGNPIFNPPAGTITPASVRLTSNTGGQAIGFRADRNGVHVGTTGTVRQTTFSLDVSVGNDIHINLNSGSSAERIGFQLNPRTQNWEAQLSGVQLASMLVGHINIPGSPVNLNNIRTEAHIPNATITYNPTSHEVSVSITPPQNTTPLPTLPTTTNDFLALTRDQIRAYQDELGSTNRTHMIHLSESAAVVPGTLPAGDGDIYINFRDSNVHTYTINTADRTFDFQTWFNGVIQRDIDIRRGSPNPPTLPADSTEEGVVYNAAQDTIFFLNPRDTSLPARVKDALGITSDSEARNIAMNGRLNIPRILQARWLQEVFPNVANREAFVRNTLSWCFEMGRSDRYFSNPGQRFLLALGMIQKNLLRQGTEPGIVQAINLYDRYPMRGIGFTNYDDPAYRGTQTPRVGVNTTSALFLPFAPAQIRDYLANPVHYHNWMPGMTASQSTEPSAFTGRFQNTPLSFTTNASTSADGTVQVQYQNQTGAQNQFPVFAGRYLLIPRVNAQGQVSGTMVLHASAITQPSSSGSDFLDSFRIDTGPLGNPRTSVFEAPERMIGDGMAELFRRPDATPVAYRFVEAQRFSRIFTGIGRGITPENIDLSGIALTPESLNFLPLGNRTIRPLRENMTLDIPEGHTELSKIRLVDIAPDDRERLTRLMTTRLGIQQSVVDQWMMAGEIPISQPGANGLPSLYNSSENIRRRFNQQHLIGWSRLFVSRLPEPFRYKGERFFLFLADLTQNFAALNGSEGDRGVFWRDMMTGVPDDRFNAWTPHNSNPSDGTSTVAISVLPNDVTAESIVRTEANPQNFHDVDSENFPMSRRVDCPAGTPQENMCSETELRILGSLVARYEITFTDPTRSLPSNRRPVGALERNDGLIMYDNQTGEASWTYLPFQAPTTFEENEGIWFTGGCLDDAGHERVVTVRTGMLNLSTQGDANFAEPALRGVSAFFGKIYLASGGHSRGRFNFLPIQSTP